MPKVEPIEFIPYSENEKVLLRDYKISQNSISSENPKFILTSYDNNYIFNKDDFIAFVTYKTEHTSFKTVDAALIALHTWIKTHPKGIK